MGTRGPVAARRAAAVMLGAGVVMVLAGCGADVEKREASSAADRFGAEVVSDPAAACALLAPRTVETLESQGSGNCAKDLADAGVPPAGSTQGVSVAGHSAQVRYAHEVVFLSLFDDGWRVTAAGCTRSSPDPSVPYDCLVEGS